MKEWDKPRPPAVCECGSPLTMHRDVTHPTTNKKVRMACPARDAVFKCQEPDKEPE